MSEIIHNATAAQYLTNYGMFHKFDASFTHEGELVHVTAHHQHDMSTAKYFADAPQGALLVSVRTITNGKRGKGRTLGDDQRKVMLSPDQAMILTPTVM